MCICSRLSARYHSWIVHITGWDLMGWAVTQTWPADYFCFDLLTCHWDQQLAFGVLYFSTWCTVSLRISVQTASLWQRARWVASDTTSQTTHQTNTLKALSTRTIYHQICVIRAVVDISTILQLSPGRGRCSTVTHLFNNDVVFIADIWCHSVLSLTSFPHLSSWSASFIPLLTPCVHTAPYKGRRHLSALRSLNLQSESHLMNSHTTPSCPTEAFFFFFFPLQ